MAKSRDKERALVKERAESDLEFFIDLVSRSRRVLGGIHRELIGWWTREDANTHQLVLLPRDHQKSALAAFRVAWEITRNPTIRILYISSTSNLAQKQLKMVKDILTSDVYRFYWPNMVNKMEGHRELWTMSEIAVDHPLRKEEGVRDPTVFTAGLTTGITGLHCDVAVLDDCVVQENAYTKEGRDKVEGQYSLLASIESADAREWVVGTRYHPNDLYQKLVETRVEQFDENGEIIGDLPLYEVFERQVENVGDGSGEFLWPRQRRYDGKFFGFNQHILAKKRSQYIDRTQFRAQYYNDPNDPEEAAISADAIQYFDRQHLNRYDGKWFYHGRRLNVFASVDFAYSLQRRADYSAIVVVGVDHDHNYYVLDIDRFKTNKISDYFKHILRLHQKWDFRKLRAEVTAAQEPIVKDIRDNYIRSHGLALSVDEYRPTKAQGSKEERVEAILQPRFENRQMWLYKGGNCQTLEEELLLRYPPHDDIKDALASCVDVCVAPTGGALKDRNRTDWSQMAHPRFGGIV